MGNRLAGRIGAKCRCYSGHNLFGLIAEDLVFAEVATNRSIRGRKLTSTGNRVVNNIFVDVKKPIASGDPSNVADYNAYVWTRNDAPGQVGDPGQHSVSLTGDVQFDGRELLLTWKPAQPLPLAPPVKGCPKDFFRHARSVENNVPGPFLAFSNVATVRLVKD